MVAREVGVSVCTASVVLNGSRSGSRISDTTREAVVEAAKRLGYRPNQVARSLYAGTTHTIGVIPSATNNDIMLGPHLQHVLNGVVNEAKAHGYDLSLITRADQSHVTDVLDVLLGGRLDGVIIVAPSEGSRLVSLVQSEGFPAVVIDGAPEECENLFMIDNASAVRTAVRYLYDLGHRNVGYIAGTQALYEARVRKDVFFSEMKDLGMRSDIRWIQLGAFDFPSGDQAMRRILSADELPSVVFCANDEMALGAIHALQVAGRRVPQEIGVIGFDDTPMAQFSRPPLTTIRHPVDIIARGAAAALIARIESGEPIGSRSFVGDLIVRESVLPLSEMEFS
jgi:LacI family transcriptional regulator